MAIKYSATARTNRMTQLNTDIGANAYIRIYSGTRPADVSASITGTLLAELRGNASGFGTASAGALTAAAITSDSSADATGTATHFRVFKSDGTTAVIDGDVGTSGSDLNLSSTSIVATGTVAVSSFVITAGNA
jgi:hypothetical protein